jgi:hypothetical protein
MRAAGCSGINITPRNATTSAMGVVEAERDTVLRESLGAPLAAGPPALRHSEISRLGGRRWTAALPLLPADAAATAELLGGLDAVLCPRAPCGG